MEGLVCTCGRAKSWEIINGATVEVCGCGTRRALRGRTLDEIAAEEARYEARIAALFAPKAVGRCTSPAGTPGCRGVTTSANAEYCSSCAEHRIRARNRSYDRRTGRRGPKALVR